MSRSILRPSLNWLLVCIPLAVLLEHLGQAPPPVVFFAAALSHLTGRDVNGPLEVRTALHQPAVRKDGRRRHVM